MTTLLIDGDLVAYRSAASAENEPLETALQRVDSLMDSFILDLSADEFKVFLTGPTNFRYDIYPEYKAHRGDVPKPRHLKDVKEYLSTQYDAITSENCEADDMMAIEQTNGNGDTIIVSLDKDMLQVPGQHYSWKIEGGPLDKRWVREAKLQYVSEIEGLRFFYTQCLKGDTSDNIKGVAGIGPKKADKLLAECETEKEMFDIVRDAYGCDEAFLMNGRVLWLQRKPEQLWEFPNFDKEV